MFNGTRVLRDGKIRRVYGDCSLREVLQEVGFGDRVDDVQKNLKTLPARHSPHVIPIRQFSV